jgi:nitrite reductase (NADH) small subunit/3-phenylpropionate/trans-cinnamate dioxygenase ferredoxin subunit
MNQYQTVCKVGEIPEGEARIFYVGQIAVGVFHVGGEYYALENDCPHAGASLARGSIEGEVVRCRIHHWGFCLRSGTYIDENKPNYNAKSYPLRIVDDQVQVCVA